jgi:hypothetical protein
MRFTVTHQSSPRTATSSQNRIDLTNEKQNVLAKSANEARRHLPRERKTGTSRGIGTDVSQGKEDTHDEIANEVHDHIPTMNEALHYQGITKVEC